MDIHDAPTRRMRKPTGDRSYKVFLLVGAVLVLLTAVLAACHGVANTQESPSEADELSRGDVTTTRPQIGTLQMPFGGVAGEPIGTCTGTMVAPDVVLTAGHCTGTVSQDFDYDFGKFIVHSSISDATFTHHVVATWGLGTGGADDLGLVRLRDPITGLAPLPLRPDEPSDGEAASMWGYGVYDCTDGGEDGHLDGQKRRYDFSWGEETHAACGGDSGGPTLTSGEVARVTSETINYLFGWYTTYGLVYAHYDELEAHIGEWSARWADSSR